MTNELKYRLYEKNDIGGILELWEKHSGWGALTEKQFNEWYINTPLGECQIIIALDYLNKIIGQIIFIPVEFLIDSQSVIAYRVSAPVIDLQIRTTDFKSFDHPVYAMYRFGLQMARSKNISILYMFPSVGWLKVIKTFPRYNLPLTDYAVFDCIKIPLSTNLSKEDVLFRENLKVNVISIFNQDHDKLWLEAVKYFPINCGVIRNKERLNYKLSPHLVIEVRSAENQLVGYLAIRKENGLIVDALAKTEIDLEIVFSNVIKFLEGFFSEENPPPWKLFDLKLISTPHLKNVISKLKHSKINYDFAFSCSLLKDTIDSEKLNSINWYMMPDD